MLYNPENIFFMNITK